VLYWTGGHPYLTQRLCRAVAEDESAGGLADVDRLCGELFLSPSAQEQDDNLLFVRERLLKSGVGYRSEEEVVAGLLDLYGQVRSGKRVRLDDTNQLVSILRLSGITRVADGCLRVRNRIYERVFDRRWVTAHMPDAELRRQRAAYRRGLVGATAIATAVVAVVSTLAVVAVSQARRAAAGQQMLRRHLYAAQMNLAQQAWAGGDLARTQELLDAQQPRSGQEDLRGFEWRYLWRLCRQEKPLYIFRNPGQFVVFSADGRIMASGGYQEVKLWDVAARRPLGTLEGIRNGVGVQQAALSPNGKLLAAGDGQKLKLWDTATRRVVGEFKGYPGPLGTVRFSPDGKTLAAADGGWWVDIPPMSMSVMKLWDVASGRELVSMRERGRMLSEAFSPDGRMLATAGIDGLIKLWSTASGRKVGELKGHTDAVSSVAFSPDGNTLISGSNDSTVKLWDVARRREIATLQSHKMSVVSVAFSPDGRDIAAGDEDNTIRLWDVATRREWKTLKGHERMVNAVAFSPDGRMLASASDDGTVRLWDAVRKADRDILTGPEGSFRCVSFSPDGEALAASTGALFVELNFGEVQLWNLSTGREWPPLREDKAGVYGVAFSPDGKTLAVPSDKGAIQLWGNPLLRQTRAGEKRNDAAWRRIGDLKDKVKTSVAYAVFSPDGKLLAAVIADERHDPAEIRLWDVSSRREVGNVRSHSPPLHVQTAAFSPDGQLLAWSDIDRTIKLWDVAARREVAVLAGHTAPVVGMAFSPGGELLASASADRTAKLWDYRNRRNIATLKGHTGVVLAVAFSPDGKTLASGSQDGTIKLWNVATGQEVASLTGHRSWVRDLAFSRDGTLLATGSYDRTVRLWRAASFAETDRPN
jgi:WD40 repeat protein